MTRHDSTVYGGIFANNVHMNELKFYETIDLPPLSPQC